MRRPHGHENSCSRTSFPFSRLRRMWGTSRFYTSPPPRPLFPLCIARLDDLAFQGFVQAGWALSKAFRSRPDSAPVHDAPCVAQDMDLKMREARGRLLSGDVFSSQNADSMPQSTAQSFRCQRYVKTPFLPQSRTGYLCSGTARAPWTRCSHGASDMRNLNFNPGLKNLM